MFCSLRQLFFWTNLCLVILAVTSKKSPGCCLPDVFELFLGVDGGINAACAVHVYKFEYLLYYDFPQQRWGVIEGKQMFNDEWDGHFVYEDYNKRAIVRAKLECKTEVMDDSWTMKRFCLPDDAEFVETLTMGYGDETLTYDTWHWTQSIWENDEERTVHVTTGVMDDCTFVNEVALWKQPSYNMSVHLGFFNIQKELSEDTVYSEISKFYLDDCPVEELFDMFDPYRTRALGYLANRIRDMPRPPPPTEEDAETEEKEKPTIGLFQ